jgi:hypothetical protein
MNITINILEVASELAHKELERRFGYEQEMIYVAPTDAITYYTEHAQDLFNTLYDEFYYLLWNLKEEEI